MTKGNGKRAIGSRRTGITDGGREREAPQGIGTRTRGTRDGARVERTASKGNERTEDGREGRRRGIGRAAVDLKATIRALKEGKTDAEHGD